MTALDLGERLRRRIRVTGVVQGVGFRPFVHRLAAELELSGEVGNDAAGVFIEAEGASEALDSFLERLVAEAPPLSRIASVTSGVAPARGESSFRIVESPSGGSPATYVAPDSAVCSDCLAELFDPFDRRYRYPFINCTNCGPRFTITKRLPYDRPFTTMRGFRLCGSCAAEYGDPRDRRFHAQPVACPACGPQISYEVAGRQPVAGTDAVLAAVFEVLGAGGIVAIKGIGGYHLACDAASPAAVGELRRRKHRPDKPFAVMVRDLAAARRLAEISPGEARLLSGVERPIVLLRRRRRAPGVSALVAPESPFLGVVLAYSPLHHLLFEAVPGAGCGAPVPKVLVMTSGNLSEEPICFEDADARARLGPVADGFLTHDRPIHLPCDDSVVRLAGGGELPIRRSRGYAPLPLRLAPTPSAAAPLLATGGELKNTFCLVSGCDAWMSQHIGDMGSLDTLRAFEASVAQFRDLYGVDPACVVADAHPGYQTRRWAEERGLPLHLVQHHHAHVASVMAENGVPDGESVVGFAFDGTGYGTDGAIWGGEILLASYSESERLAHLAYVSLPGGDVAVRRPYRAALAHLRAAGVPWELALAPVRAARPAELGVLGRQLERGFQCV
ncbi:MAG: carbamoyltransferase HypF, partial [Acidimicrobiales bacterium]